MNGKQYRYLETGELIEPGDEWRAHDNLHYWKKSICEGHPVGSENRNCYRRLIPESRPNDEETDVPISTDRGEAPTDSSSDKPNRNRHITVNKSDYCWDGTVDLTKQHCISVSVEEI